MSQANANRGDSEIEVTILSTECLRLVGEAGVLDGPTLRERLKALGFGRMHISQVLPKLERKGLLVSRRVNRMKVYELPQPENQSPQPNEPISDREEYRHDHGRS